MTTVPMDEALAAVTEARAHLVVALDLIEKRRDLPDDVDELRSTVGYLASIISKWERERARWVP